MSTWFILWVWVDLTQETKSKQGPELILMGVEGETFIFNPDLNVNIYVKSLTFLLIMDN